MSKGEKSKKKHYGGHTVTIKNIVIPLEVEYLEKAARERGISRSMLARIVMEKVVSDELIPSILGYHNGRTASVRKQFRFDHAVCCPLGPVDGHDLTR